MWFDRCWSLDKEAVVMKEMVGFGGDQCEVMEGLLCKVDCRQSHLLTGEQPHSLLVHNSPCFLFNLTLSIIFSVGGWVLRHLPDYHRECECCVFP